jgi:ribosomal protein S18 acetylase RimI-like enzyme
MLKTRRLTSGDLGLLDNIAADVFDGQIDRVRMAAYLDAPGHMLIVAVIEQQVVGQVAACLHQHVDQAPALYIDNLGVAPAFQRRGIARRLVDEMLDWGASSGCRQAWLVTEPDNVAARALYTARGARAEPIVMFSYELAGRTG